VNSGKNIRNDENMADLVLEGGGVKGIGLVGAISALHERGYQFDGRHGRVAGTSAGAIVGSLVAAGMPIPKMVEVMKGVDYALFQDSASLGPIGRGVSLLTRLGLFRGDYLHQWITDQLTACDVQTFGDLRLDDPQSDLPPEQAYRLVVVVSDVTSGRMVRLPWDYHQYGLNPDEQPVADAVRASASIPFFYRPFQLKLPDSGKVAVLTDGGMLSNFPINIFDRTHGTPRWPTFGVKLSAKTVDRWTDDWASVGTPIRLGRALVSTMVNAHDRLELDDPAVCARTIFVETDGVRATDFHLSADKRDELYENGRAGTIDFLAGWDFAEYLRRYRS
jgi:NTE family protein